MDRQIVYPGAIPLETDLLNTNKNAMVGLAKLAAAVLGTSTMLNGLAVTANSPADLTVKVAPGEIYSLQNLDGTAYSSIAADTAHAVLKQGLMLDQATLACPAPVTAGYSVNYLIQVAYQDTDSGAVVLPYYNASNPSQAYAGPNNSGTAQNTVRKGVCSVSAKAGIAATTGTQATPAPDAGYIGAFVVTVAYGQTQITAPNISAYAGAPFLPSGGLVVGGLQGNACNISAAGGTADAITGRYTPGITALTNGMTLYVRAASANATATPTFTPASGTIAAKTIVKGNGLALVAGDIAGSGHWIELQYDAALDKWVLQNPTYGFGGTPAQFDNTPKNATTAFVQRALGNLQTIANYAVSSTIPNSGVGGVHLPTVAGTTLTLPQGSAVPPGSTITIHGNSWGCTVARQGSDTIALGSGGAVTSVAVGPFDRLILVNTGPNWYAIGGETALGQSSAFAALLGSTSDAAGYQKLPGGLIIQWGRGLFNAVGGDAQTLTFPIAFPNNAITGVATSASGVGAGGTAAVPIVAIINTTTTQITVQQVSNNATGTYFRWIALGK